MERELSDGREHVRRHVPNVVAPEVLSGLPYGSELPPQVTGKDVTGSVSASDMVLKLREERL
ncbi:hypothetical protein [Saccharomonospora piscinae]|nr:hypothetical protein [Saccharomonospora piscinae]TLW91970.1 hypothetical protein FFT09_13795 [Saccharomonospora piscinae]